MAAPVCYKRDGSWSYEAHRRIFDAYQGAKVEYTSVPVLG